MTHSQVPVDPGAEIRISVEIQARELPWPTLSAPCLAELRSDADELTFGSILGETLTGCCDLGELENTLQNRIHQFLGVEAESEGSGGLVHLYPGLKVVGSDGTEVSSGCCACLEDWRDWYGVLRGESPFGGHDPSAYAFLEGEVVVVRLEPGMSLLPPSEIRMPVARYVGQLDAVGVELQRWLERVGRWIAANSDDESAARIMRRIDRDLNITPGHPRS